MGVRGAWVGVVAVVAAGGLAAASLAGPSTTPPSDLPVLGMYGTGDVPPVDGDDERVRLEVAVDHAALLSTAAAAAAEEAPDNGLSENDRALRQELAASGWGGLTAEAPSDTATLPWLDLGPTELHGLVADAITALVDGVEEVLPVGGNRYELVGATLAQGAAAAVPGLADVAEVPLVVPFGSNDPHVELQWGLDNTGQTFGTATGIPGIDVGFTETLGAADGSGVVVAVVDTGVDTDHPDLADRLWTNPDETCGDGDDDDGNGYVDDCGGWDFVNGDASVDDAGADNRHGTHVAGIIAASTHDGVGVASLAGGATIMPLKVFGAGSAPATRIATAIEYAVDNGADVINLSLGGPGASPAQAAAIERARQAGVLVVAAAGNDGTDNDVTPIYPASFPHDNVIAVGSHGNGGAVSSFSNRGATSVDVLAPGENVLSTLPDGWGYLSGTSMAAPMVSAMAAVVGQSWGTTDAAAVRAEVLRSVERAADYRGVVATTGRVHAPMALRGGTMLGNLDATVAGLDGATAGVVTAQVRAVMRNAALHGVELELQLARLWDGAVHAVVDHPVTVTADGASAELATDGTGTLDVPSSEGLLAALSAGTLDLDVATTLPDGAYLLAVHATTSGGVGDTSTGEAQPLGAAGGDRVRHEPVAVLFHVGDVTSTQGGATGSGADDTVAGGDGAADDGGATGDGSTGSGGSAGDSGDGGTDAGACTGTCDGTAGSGGAAGNGGAADGADDEGATSGGAGSGSSDGDGSGSGAAADGDGGSGGAGGVAGDTGDSGAPTGRDGGDSSGSGGTGGPAADTTPTPSTAVWPAEGPTSGGTWVTVKGEFDPADDLYVHFGGTVHRPVLVTSWALGIITEPAAAGTVDVVVHGGAAEVVHPGAFTYVDGDGTGSGAGDDTTVDAPDPLPGDPGELPPVEQCADQRGGEGEPPVGDSTEDADGEHADDEDDEDEAEDEAEDDGDDEDDDRDDEDERERPRRDSPADRDGDGDRDGDDRDLDRERRGQVEEPGGRARQQAVPCGGTGGGWVDGGVGPTTVAGTPTDTGDGLTVDRVTGGPLLGLDAADWDRLACSTGTCRAVVLFD